MWLYSAMGVMLWAYRARRERVAPRGCDGVNGVFVTGTDTGVGKTLASTALLHAMRSAGVRALGMKPVASGCERIDGRWRNDDALALQHAGAFEVPYEDVNPFALEHPLAPELAARDAGIEVTLQPILDAHERLRAQADCVVVEGVGGWMAPLAADLMQADLVRALDDSRRARRRLAPGLPEPCVSHRARDRGRWLPPRRLDRHGDRSGDGARRRQPRPAHRAPAGTVLGRAAACAGAGAFTHVAPPSMAADGSLRPSSSRCNRNQFPCDVQTRDQRQGFHAPVRKVNSRVQKTEEEAPRMARKLGSNGTNARIAGMLAVAILVAACGKGDPNAAGGEMPPPEVGVVTVKPAAVPLVKDLVGRLAAYRSADVRARVPGVLQRRVYEEGSDVKEGQLLFVIDPAPLQAALGQAVASQASAQANYPTRAPPPNARAISRRRSSSRSPTSTTRSPPNARPPLRCSRRRRRSTPRASTWAMPRCVRRSTAAPASSR